MGVLQAARAGKAVTSEWVSARTGQVFNHSPWTGAIMAAHPQRALTMRAFLSLWMNTMNRCTRPHGEARP